MEPASGVVNNFIGGEWRRVQATASLPVINPATEEPLASVPLSTAADAAEAVEAARRAFPGWRRVPAGERIQFLFRLKALLEENLEDLARTITLECGKTLAESRGEMRRAIENTEVACGIPALMQGVNSEDIAAGIDEHLIRQPLGVTAIIAPFNFPAMIPFWFFPYAAACGNTCVVKPSEKTPLTMTKIIGLIERSGLPEGVVNIVHGTREAVDALIDHPAVRAVSFVGSTPVAKYVYARAAANGKRVQCQGGAKNVVAVMEDCDLDAATRIIADSAFGCAGQRCLAASLAVGVGAAARPFRDAIAEAARSRVVGNGLDAGVEMGPVISAQSRARIEGLIDSAVREGARTVAGGRAAEHTRGFFLRPAVLDGLDPAGETARTEIFGPVLGLISASSLEETIALINGARYGNMACLFTSSGAAARKFRSEVECGNIGINVGVAAPIAWFPFSGWKESFFGDLHGQGRDAVEFFTQEKVVVERWHAAWSRRF